jgi:hypothetical protein
MQYINPRHAVFLWDAVDALRPNQEMRCTLPKRPNEHWMIRYTEMGWRCPIVEISNFDEEDGTSACFCFLLESRRHALLLSLRGYRPERDERRHEDLVTLSGSGLPSIRDLDKHQAWTQLVNTIFSGAK